MTVAVPDFHAGAVRFDPDRSARVLLGHAGWIRRRCNEIIAETALDVAKIYDLAGQCFNFRAEADKWIEGGQVVTILDALIALTLAQTGTTKTAQEIDAGYRGLYDAAGTFLTWAGANLPAQGETVPGSPAVTVNRVWPRYDLVVTTAKAPGVTTAVQALLDEFD